MGLQRRCTAKKSVPPVLRWRLDTPLQWARLLCAGGAPGGLSTPSDSAQRS